jgi:prepilin-type processing-associated H-X9-DG protein
MSINFKVAALALGVASLFGAGQANAAACDGSVEQMRNGMTKQCYYLPTVSNGSVSGLEKQVIYHGRSPYGGSHPGATIGTQYPHVVIAPRHPK